MNHKPKHNRLVKLIMIGVLSGVTVFAWGQAGTIHFIADYSMRNSSLSHKYEMVSWDASVYREFAYWTENASGGPTEFMNWRAIFPAGYDSASITKYPMIVMLHGAGESGREWTDRYVYSPTDPRYDNNGNNLLWGGSEHRNAVTSGSFPGIVIFPQVNYNGAWSGDWDSGATTANERMAALIIEHMISTWGADPNRIAVHGLSNGAKGVWDFAAKRPDLFAAILPMSGVGTDMNAMTDILVTTPLWQFQGGTDTNPSQGNTTNWINALKSRGGNPRYTIYPSLGHGVWTTAYAEPDFFSWILSQNKRNIHVFGGSTILCAGSTIQLGISDGYLGYQWTLNGADISGATSRTYVASQGGTYAVRFRRRVDGVWDTSNTVELQAPGSGAAPLLTHTGSTYLPIQIAGSVDNILNLVAPAGYAQYRWYKNGTLWSTTATNVKLIANSTGNNSAFAGAYTVQVQLPAGCYSLTSNAVNIQFNNPQPTTPSFNILSRTAVSPTQINVTWENPAGETGFEIWRYRKGDYVAGPPATGYPLEKFSLVGTVGPDVTMWSDTGLRPGASYIYRVRAIVSGGTSLSNQPNPTYVIMPVDATAPSPPAQFVATSIEPTEIALAWAASADNDNNFIYAYEVYNDVTLLATLRSDTLDADRTNGNPAAPTGYAAKGLTPNTSYTFNVRSRDYKGNFSAYTTLTVSTLANLNGVEYQYWHFAGTLSSLAAFNFFQAPLEEGVVTNFDLSVRNQEDRFVFDYTSYLQIDAPGTYRFYTNSDDGSRLYIDGTLVVNNDGAHGPRTVSGTYTFPEQGKYSIRVSFFEQGGGQTLIVKYNPGTTNNYTTATVIPDDKLFLFDDPSGFARMATQQEEVVVEENQGVQEDELVAWPMPFNDKLNLKVNQTHGIVRVIVLNHMGNPVMTVPVLSFMNNVEMDLQELPEGQYFLVVGRKRVRVAKINN
jgi:predicted esterase